MSHEATTDNPYTRGIAQFVANLQYDAIPQEVRSRIKLLMLDSFGCADLMQLRLKEGDELLLEAREIARAAERGAALTRQLLLFSLRQSVEPLLVDVHEVLRGFDSMLQRIAGEITLRLHTSGPSPKVRLEPGQLEQVKPVCGKFARSMASVRMAAAAREPCDPIFGMPIISTARPSEWASSGKGASEKSMP